METIKQTLTQGVIENNNIVQENLNTIMYAVGDSSKPFTEDTLLNMLIGVSQLHESNTNRLLDKITASEWFGEPLS